MYKIFRLIAPVLMLVSVLLLPCLAFADGPAQRLQTMGNDSGFKTEAQDASLSAIVGKVIGVVLSVLGIVFLVLIIYAGFIWMIAAGDEGKVTRAKDTMRRAIIGLVIVIAAYAISQFVFYSLLE